MSTLQTLKVPEHIRNLNVGWLELVTYYSLACERIGIETIGDLLNADTNQLDTVCINGDSDIEEMRLAIVDICKRYPSPVDIPSDDVLVAEELARVTRQRMASRGKP